MAGLIVPGEGKSCSAMATFSKWAWSIIVGYIAAILQDDQLFAGTIAEKISCFDPHADQTSVEECAQRVALADEIMATPLRYALLIGAMGISLSDGHANNSAGWYKRPLISEEEHQFFQEKSTEPGRRLWSVAMESKEVL